MDLAGLRVLARWLLSRTGMATSHPSPPLPESGARRRCGLLLVTLAAACADPGLAADDPDEAVAAAQRALDESVPQVTSYNGDGYPDGLLCNASAWRSVTCRTESPRGYTYSTGNAFPAFAVARAVDDLGWTGCSGLVQRDVGGHDACYFSAGVGWSSRYPGGTQDGNTDGEGFYTWCSQGVVELNPATGCVYTLTHGYPAQRLRDRYWGLGNFAGKLGRPRSHYIDDGGGRYHAYFDHGSIHTGGTAATTWYVGGARNDGTAHVDNPDHLAIAMKHFQNTGALSRIGAPSSDPTRVSAARMHQAFENGRIFWLATWGAKVFSYGAAYDEWLELGWTSSYPTTDAVSLNGGRYQSFEGNRRIYTSPHGAFGVAGTILSTYLAVGGPSGGFGWPTSDEIDPTQSYCDAESGCGGLHQRFEHGVIYADGTTQSYASLPACSHDLCDGLVAGAAQRYCRDEAAQPQVCRDWGADVGDVDLDDVPDALERALAARFFPRLQMSRLEEALAAFYGSYPHAALYWNWQTSAFESRWITPPTYTYGGADMPFVVRRVAAAHCGGHDSCLEILYAMPYWKDFGNGTFFDTGHVGDSELVAVLLVGTASGGWSVDRTSADGWVLQAAFASAHQCAKSFSTFASPAPGQIVTEGVTVFVDNGKHAAYFSRSDCNAGGPYRTDSCDDNDPIDTGYAIAELANAGEEFAHQGPGLDAYTAFPGDHPWSVVHQAYALWSGDDFGESSSYLAKLRAGVLDWSNHATLCDDGYEVESSITLPADPG